MTTPLSILVVSPDAAVRQDVIAQFERATGMQSVCIEAETTSRGYDLAVARKPATALLDLRTEPEETLRVVPRILAEAPGLRIVGLYSPLQMTLGLEQSQLFLEGVRCGLFDFLSLPLSPDEARRVFNRIVPIAAAPTNGHPKGRVLSFFSSKGGVGKTTLAVNTAVALARRFPDEVGLIDGSLEVGSVCDFVNVRTEKSLWDAAQAGARLDRDLLRSMMTRHEESGVWVLGCPLAVEQIAALTDDDLMRVLLAARDAFRMVVVDTYPLFNAMSIAIGDLSDRIYIVTEAIVPAVNGTVHLLAKLQDAGYPAERMRVILNRYTRFRGNVEPDVVAEALRRDVDWVLPYDKAMHTCANIGRPYLLQSPRSALARKIETLALDGLGEAAPAARRSFWSFLSRS